jgi:hypothetical protein
MNISISDPSEIAKFSAVSVTSLEQMAELCLKNNFSPAIFKDGKRNLANFEMAYCIGLDVDNDGKLVQGKHVPEMTIEQAKEAFNDYTHLILPSRSHQKLKDGRVCDRFRIILFFTEPITDIDTFYATWFWCKEQWPAIDPQCKDPSRFYYKHSDIASTRAHGLRIKPVAPKPKELVERVDLSNISAHDRGKLSRSTLEFLLNGAEQGNRNGSVYNAAKEFQQNLYSLDEASQRIVDALNHTDTFARDFTEAEALQTIRSAFNTDPKHDPRIKQKAFNLVRIGELYKSKAVVEWIVDGLFSAGGVSLMSSDPKAGKSTLVRQLMREILRGKTFLGRQCKQGSVHYYGIEEQLEVVNASFKRLGITAADPLLVHIGDPLAETKMEDFRELLLEHKPMLVVIDTLFDFLDVESENNYKEVKRELRKLRQIARETGTHILCVHHNSKGSKDDKRRGNRGILGSQAIAGGVDTIVVIEVEGRKRLIGTSGREIKSWRNREIIFNFEDCTYTLGAEVDEFA